MRTTTAAALVVLTVRPNNRQRCTPPRMKSTRVEGVTFDQVVEVRMRDGVRLMANVFRPALEWPCPVVMSVTPYGKDVMPDHAREAFMIIEMRTYRTKPGMRDEFLTIFRAKTMPAHREIAMKILGPLLSIEDADTFFFMRGFPTLESRGPMKKVFYEGELWKGELELMLLPMLEKYDVVLVEADESPGGWQ